MNKELIRQLKQLKTDNGRINADLIWIKQNRHQLLSSIRPTGIAQAPAVTTGLFLAQILSGLSRAAQIFVSGRVVSIARYSFTVMLIAAVAVSSWIATVSASQTSLPGDALYNVKLATEKTELFVTTVIGSEAEAVSTLLKHASARVDEYQKIKGNSPVQATRAIESLRKTIESTNKQLEKVGNKSGVSGKASAVAKVIEKQTTEILASLEQKNPENAFAPSGRQVWPGEAVDKALNKADKAVLNKEVEKATQVLEATGVKAVEVLIKKEKEGDKNVKIGDAKESVEKKLDKIVDDLAGLKQNVAEATTDVAKIIAANSTSTVAGGSLPTVSEATNLVTTTERLAVEKVKQTDEKVTQANKVVGDTVAEARNLIQQNDLQGALNKVKELNAVKKEAREAVLEANEAVKDAAKESLGELQVQAGSTLKAQSAGVSSSTATSVSIATTTFFTPTTDKLIIK